jgi:two-component system, sensor histidine kinase PdtaS
MTGLKDKLESNLLKKHNDKKDLHQSFMCRNCRIKKDTKEKDLIFQEIHHRVKNNLQIISSILSMQIQEISDDKTISIVNECIARIKSMALIHEKLCFSVHRDKINFSEYLNDLMVDIYNIYTIDYNKVKYVIDSDNILLKIDHAIPCSLIVTELVTNSLKYAFPDERKGEIIVSLSYANKYVLRIKDNGIGLKSNFYNDTNSLGSKLIKALVYQLSGKISIENTNGTEVTIIF